MGLSLSPLCWTGRRSGWPSAGPAAVEDSGERWALSELGSEEGCWYNFSPPMGWPRKIHRSWVTAGLGSE